MSMHCSAPMMMLIAPILEQASLAAAIAICHDNRKLVSFQAADCMTALPGSTGATRMPEHAFQMVVIVQPSQSMIK